MLSYRHAYHAGNHADVLKHIVWQHILQHLNKKDKPYCIIDTHAGASTYNLESDHALKTAEFRHGIAQLWAMTADKSQKVDIPDAVEAYLQIVEQLNPDHQLKTYPGSPWFTMQALRSHDRAWFYELHRNDFGNLQKRIAILANKRVIHGRKVTALNEDGFAGLLAKCPPVEKRGAVLIDPSYEVKADYQAVTDLLKQAHQRFSTGTFACWYPVVERARINKMERELKNSGIRDIQLYELGVNKDQYAHGMTASGMIVINPPWTLTPAMQQTLPWLEDMLNKLSAQENLNLQPHWRYAEITPE